MLNLNFIDLFHKFLLKKKNFAVLFQVAMDNKFFFWFSDFHFIKFWVNQRLRTKTICATINA
jgi:hypothetical protein